MKTIQVITSLIFALTMAPTMFGVQYLISFSIFPLEAIEKIFGDINSVVLYHIVSTSKERMEYIVGWDSSSPSTFAVCMAAAPFMFWIKYFISWLAFPLFILEKGLKIDLPEKYTKPIISSMDAMLNLSGLY